MINLQKGKWKIFLLSATCRLCLTNYSGCTEIENILPTIMNFYIKRANIVTFLYAPCHFYMLSIIFIRYVSFLYATYHFYMLRIIFICYVSFLYMHRQFSSIWTARMRSKSWIWIRVNKMYGSGHNSKFFNV